MVHWLLVLQETEMLVAHIQHTTQMVVVKDFLTTLSAVAAVQVLLAVLVQQQHQGQ
jgi:hypothetical protein